MGRSSLPPPIRYLFATGPGDAVSAAHAWQSKHPMQSTLTTTFTAETLDYCLISAKTAALISSHSRADRVSFEKGFVENRPKKVYFGGEGWSFHLGEFAYALSLLSTARALKVQVAVVDSGTTHWFLLSIFRLFGIDVVVNLHNSLIPLKRRQGWFHRVISKLDDWFFFNMAQGALAVSHKCVRDFEGKSGGKRPVQLFRANYTTKEFKNIRVATFPEGAPKILFVGRIEENKGIFDLLDVVTNLVNSQFPALTLEVCGGGGELERFKEKVSSLGAEQFCLVHGQLDRSSILEKYKNCDVVVVPTRSEFAEGFALVCLEAALAGRVVLGSSAVPALEHLSEATVCFDVDDKEHLELQLRELLSDESRFNSVAEKSQSEAIQYLDSTPIFSKALELLFRRYV